ncbi:ankyrin repeat-containing protein [Zea mays]|uniref:Ankyrin repeat-containing protein n=1 Tax=Zea mays TaxID=4577 RepID=A0A1D6HJJ9_MAIZE|nr:ankyrin repeat-containing protein [Zea mays]AQK74646.1 Ankyrin repeat-containing protein [Zea mays]AQK74647.1 Ankyrin repeat-containing protein [Zea mays]AQK74648.1 Ankyrin repeat-containing protein [Zea mays]|eukprot:NP_001317513.1 ankyrin repeat-containing protein [Zea mays]
MDLPPLSHQALFAAVRSADAAAVRALLADAEASGTSLAALAAAQTDAGETALYVAAEAGSEETVSLLLPLYDLEAATVRSRLDLDAFHVAAKQGHTGVVKEFLGRWPGLCSVCDSSNTSPLYSAAVKDHLDVVNAILDTDDSCIRIVRKNGKTSLHTAARIGYHRIVKALIERDPGIVPIKDRKGQTALHMAVKGKNTDVVEELLMADVSILNVRDKKGNTALHIATRKWRPQMVQLLLSYESLEINAINIQNETAMDLADKVPYGESKTEIIEWLTEAGAKNARNVGKIDEASELRRTVSDIKHNVQAQLSENAKTNKRVTGIRKELQKLHREAIQNTINSVTMVATLIASIAFVAIFNLPGQYFQDVNSGGDIGEAQIAKLTGFRVFCLLNATALFISLAVVVVQITLVAWETGAQKQVIKIVNKLMWTACLSTGAAFISLAYVVVGPQHAWMAFTVSAIGGPIMIGTLLFLAYLLLRPRFKFGEDRQRRIKRASGSKSFSWSLHDGFSDLEAFSDHEKKIYAL